MCWRTIRRKAPEDGIALFDWEHADVARHGGDETVLLGGSFVFQGGSVQRLLDALSPFMHNPGQGPLRQRPLRGTLEILDREIRSSQMARCGDDPTRGGDSAGSGAAGLCGGAWRHSAGWIGALADRRIGAALHRMHDKVGHRWTVGELARSVGMSRSGFAARFRDLVGVPPLGYMLQWRMQVAREALRRDEASVASLAAELGYASESAFGHAFKRVCGRAPKRYWQAGDGIRSPVA